MGKEKGDQPLGAGAAEEKKGGVCVGGGGEWAGLF